MKIVITGALGHIGSRMIRSPRLNAFDEVVMIDNLATQRYSSLFELPSGIRYRFEARDILSDDLERIFEGSAAVIHLAAITDAESSVSNPDQVMKVNVEGTLRVAQACLRSGSRLILASTTSVYGPQDGEVDEDCHEDQLRPQSPYAESKLEAERSLAEMSLKSPLRFTICRMGTIFGVSPGMRFHTAVNKFIWQASTGQPLTVWSTAMDQRRPYLDLEDALEAIFFIVERDLFHQSIYNVVTLNATVREIIDSISIRIPDLDVSYVDSPIMNQLSYNVARRKIESEGFAFRGSLQRGIDQTIDWLEPIVPKRTE